MKQRKTPFLTYVNPDSDLHDLSMLFTPKANRAARRDRDLAKRRENYERKVALRADRTFLSTKGQ